LKPLLVFFANEEEERLIGRALKPALVRAIKKSRGVVLLDSDMARSSEYVAAELRAALDRPTTSSPWSQGADNTTRPPWTHLIQPTPPESMPDRYR
jgi:hypothetical protein